MSGRGGGPVVNVTVLADATDIKRKFATVSTDAKKMGDDVDTAGHTGSGGIARLTDAADGGERRFRGMNDTIGGTQNLMSGLASGDIVGVISGLTDLAGGIADFVGPALAKMAEKLGLVTAATVVETEAQVASNTAMALNPIGIVVIALVALVAAFYLAWKNSETFRNIVTGAFDAVRDVIVGVYEWVRDNWPLLLAILTGPIGLAVLAIVGHWDTIKNTFTGVKDWISQKVDDIVGFITGLPGRLAQMVLDMAAKGVEMGKALVDGAIEGIKGLGAAILGAGGAAADFAGQIIGVVKDFVNVQIIDRINNVLDAVKIPLPFGQSIDIPNPNIPHLASGAVVRYRPGGTLALIGEAGDEAVIPMSRIGAGAGGQTVVHMNFPAGIDPARAFDAVERYKRRNGIGS